MRTAAIAIGAAILLALVGRASDYHGPNAALLFALGGPWVVTAFAVAAWTRSATAGAFACAASVPGYYALMLIAEGRAGPGYALSMTVLWGAAAVACGALFGWLGAVARREAGGRRAAAVAAVGGTLAGEALLFLLLHPNHGASPVLVAELALGAALVGAATWPGRASALATAGGAAGVAAIADGALRLVMRAQGWGGG